MAAFEQACGLSRGFECDLQLTRTKELVVMHDANLWRTASFPKRNFAASWLLRALPLVWLAYDDVKDADCGSGERLPRAADALSLAKAQNKTVFMELKPPESGSSLELDATADAAVDAAEASALPAELCVWISDSVELAAAMKKRLPGHASYLVGTAHTEEEMYAVAQLAKAHGLDGVDVNAGAHVTPEVVARCAAEGLRVIVYVWRAPAGNDTPELWAAMKKAGVYAFTSNLPVGVEAAALEN